MIKISIKLFMYKIQLDAETCQLQIFHCFMQFLFTVKMLTVNFVKAILHRKLVLKSNVDKSLK